MKKKENLKILLLLLLGIIISSCVDDYDLNENNRTQSVKTRDFKTTKIGNNVEFINIATKEVLKNESVRKALLKHPKFKKVTKISDRVTYLSKKRLSEKKTLKSLVKAFKKNHCKSKEEIQDINIIISRL